MYSQEKNEGTQHKMLKHAGYKSEEKRSIVDAFSQQPMLHKHNTLTNINKHYSK